MDQEQPLGPPQNPPSAVPPRTTVTVARSEAKTFGADLAFPQNQTPLPVFPSAAFAGDSGPVTSSTFGVVSMKPVTASIVPAMPFTKQSAGPAAPAILPEGAKKHQAMFGAFPLQETIKRIQEPARTTGLTTEGSLRKEWLDYQLGPYAETVKRTVGFKYEDAEYRQSRAMKAQHDGQQLHEQMHKPAPVNLINKIVKDEKILHVLHTIGFERFPGSGSTLLGDGMVILTENNLYFHHDGNTAVAQVEENLLGTIKGVTPFTPKYHRKCMELLCGCFKCCRDLNGAYTHIADRESRTALSIISVPEQLMDAHFENVLTTRLERTYRFPANMTCCVCCKCLVRCCIRCRRKRTTYFGRTHAKTETRYPEGADMEKAIIIERKEGDESYWYPWEIEQLRVLGSENSYSDEDWFHISMTYFQGRTVEHLKMKYNELKKGVGTIEKTRLGRYRAVYIPFRDAGSSIVREAVCMVDGETTSQEDIYDFVLTAKKLASYNRERNRKNDQVNSMFMDESDYMNRDIRDIVLHPPVKDTWAGAMSDAIASLITCAPCMWWKARKNRSKADVYGHTHSHTPH